MLTLLKNIERFNKRYNKKRGSAMLMVLMTMAIIIVVGTSMLFVTLSSFSNSIADTQQERAYNAALTVSDTLKGSTQLNTIIETYFTKIKENGFAEVQFYNDADFDNQAVNYTIVNGVKVYVTLSKSPSSSANKIDKVLVDIKGVKGSQESTVSFEADSVPDGNSTTIQDTFGNSFVVSNNMGSSVTSPYQIYKRIEGDVSINCFDTENGERVMKTRIFNPVVLEGVTGSIYANGDLIIGAPDNMLRVQGNVYVDGNLTIRGLALGVNLPALTKKYYAKKYIYYHTYAYGEFGSVAIPPNNNLTDRNSETTILGEAMYENYGDEENPLYRPIQVYDKLSHYTLMDLAGEDATEYTFWTKNYGEKSTGSYTWEKVTITLRVLGDDNELHPIEATDSRNEQYLGASMYEYKEGEGEPKDEGTPIMQYPEGGNVYCSGDIIFDTVNYGNVISYDAGIINLGTTDNEQENNNDETVDSEQENNNDETVDSETLKGWIKEHFGIDLVNPEISYYSLAYNLDGKGDGTIPVHTKIEGDVFCQGRMIIAPDTRPSYKDYKNEEKLNITSDFSNKYINKSTINGNNFVLNNGSNFLTQVKNKWKELTGGEWGTKCTINMIKPPSDLNVGSLKNLFDSLAGGDYSYLVGDNYTRFGQYFDEKENEWVNYNNIAEFRTPSFSETSNLYIQNEPIRKGTGETAIEKSEVYATDDPLRVVQTNVDSNGKPVTNKSVVGDIAYTAALTVKYCAINVNNVYCNGDISVLESKIPGFENAALVTANTYFYSNAIKSEIKYSSILEYLEDHLKKDKDSIMEDYFGMPDEDSLISAQKTWNSVLTKEVPLSDIKITYERKVIVLRAAMELTEAAKWENDPEYDIIKPTSLNPFTHDEHHSKITNNWKKTYFSRNWRYYADLMYVVDAKPTEVSGDPSNYLLNWYSLKGKVMTSEGEEADLSREDKKAVKELVEKIKEKLEGMNDTQKDEYINYVNTSFLNSIDNDEYRMQVYNQLVQENKIKTFGNEPIKDRNVQYEREQITCKAPVIFVDEQNCFEVDLAASYSYTVEEQILVNKETLNGGTLSDKEVSINRDYVLNSKFLNNQQLVLMYSDRNNDFGGIINDSIVTDSAIGAGPNVALEFGEGGGISDQFDAMKGTTSAFKDNSKYGMYLVIDKKYSNVNKDAYVSAIFDEIKSSKFATVVEANSDQEKSKENIKTLLNNLKKDGKLVEYNAFDIYGSVNEYDKYLGIKSGKDVDKYICADGEQLTKKIFKMSFWEPTNAESWTKVGPIWCYIESSDKVEDSGSLRLMDFYNKNDENVKHLRADSTFAIDEKYNETFTGLTDKKLDILSGKFPSLTVNRSEVQYTIKQNTYFNFEESNTQIVFGASTDGVDKRVRMNFLIDTSEKDIYVFFHCKALDKSKDKKEQTRFLFQKCSFQVTGKNNAYLMLVDDTSFAANAYSLEISNTMLSEDKTDEKIGTHFKSNTYQKYVARFKEHGGTVSAFDLVALTNAIQLKALPDGDPAKVGNMFIIGMGRNYVKFGRGGSVNAMVYIPNGMYSNESSGLFNSIPIGNSGNNEASIVAKDIYIGGSSRGQLIFSSYDAAKIGSKNNNSSGLVMDGLINPDTVSHDTKWVAGDYYYG